MKNLTTLLRESLPEIIGGLVVASILAIVGLLYTELGIWTVTFIIVATLIIATVLWLLLARQKKAKPQVHRNSIPPTSAIAPQNLQLLSSQKQSILVVDDDIETISPVFVPLEKAGFHLLVATNLSQAIDILHSKPRIDLVIIDIIIPRGKKKDGEEGQAEYLGLEVVEQVRKLYGDIPIIAFSVTLGNEEIRQRLEQLGVTEQQQLRKPILLSVLAEQVKLALLLSQQPPQQEMIVDEIRRRKFELASENTNTRVRAIWALGELGHHEPTVMNLLEDLAKSDDPSVQKAANQAIGKIQRRLSTQV